MREYAAAGRGGQVRCSARPDAGRHRGDLVGGVLGEGQRVAQRVGDRGDPVRRRADARAPGWNVYTVSFLSVSVNPPGYRLERRVPARRRRDTTRRRSARTRPAPRPGR